MDKQDKHLQGSDTEEIGTVSCVDANRLLVNEQMVDLEDRVIELQNEAARLCSMAAAREAYVVALRTPVVTVAAVPEPTQVHSVQIEQLVDLDDDGDDAGSFFSGAVADEPARAWLLGKK